MKGFEEKVVEALEKETALQKSIATAAAAEIAPVPTIQEDDIPDNISVVPILQDLVDPTSISASEEISKADFPPVLPDRLDWQGSWSHILQTYRSRLLQLFSSQQVELRQVDITTKFIEGAFSSAVAISLLAAIFRGR